MCKAKPWRNSETGIQPQQHTNKKKTLFRYKKLGAWEEPVPVVVERVKEFEAFLVSLNVKKIAVVCLLLFTFIYSSDFNKK